MKPMTSTLTALADLLEHPGSEFPSRLARSAEHCPALQSFCTAISALTPDAREELYTGTFDVTPACVAYVSIHLFGEENFKRGEFMAGLHARYRQAGFDPRGELPDHLALLLRYTAQTEEAERRELVEFCLLGPIGKMIAALNEANPYRALLEAVRATLQAAYPDVTPALSPVEQMRQHGGGCAVVSAGCNCGATGIQNGPDDDAEPAEVHAPVESGRSLISTP
jgi:nitrate reductase delta subunit